MKFWLTMAAVALIAPLVHAAPEAGTDYQLLANPQPTLDADKIEVRELFWYGCPHCYHLEPQLEAWRKEQGEDVDFVRMPAILGPSWELLARGYYTAQLLGVEDKIHKPLFERLHKQRKPVRDVADLKAFFEQQGVSGEDFDSTFQSFDVATKTGRARQVRALYGVTGVPVIVVNGRYLVSAQMAGGNEQMLEVVDYLVEKERAGTDEAAPQAPAAQ
jgi:thiol:disulfide interchange protein DsbA